jgi:hypothetical protein
VLNKSSRVYPQVKEEIFITSSRAHVVSTMLTVDLFPLGEQHPKGLITASLSLKKSNFLAKKKKSPSTSWCKGDAWASVASTSGKE